MEMIQYIVIILWAVIFILLIARFFISAVSIYTPYAPSRRGAEIGSSMTIGTREVQEDCYGFLETASGTLTVLADGMGKAYGGRIASRTAVETFKDIFGDYNAFDNPPYFFRKAFNSANREILKKLDNGQNGAASVGAAVIIQGRLYYAVVGNVKVCVYRDGELVPMSMGHTVNQLAESGFRSGQISREAAITMIEDHRTYNYIGQDEFRDVELYDTPVALRSGDIVVLMSDGVYETLSWKEIEDVLAAGGDCQTLAFEIIEKINRMEEENKDNASLMLIRPAEGALL